MLESHLASAKYMQRAGLWDLLANGNQWAWWFEEDIKTESGICNEGDRVKPVGGNKSEPTIICEYEIRK